MAIRPLKDNPPISCDSKCHVARGSAPGTDYAVSEGTTVIAPFSGTVTIGYNSRAGDYTSVLSNTGIRVYLMHLKERMVTSGFVNEGQDLALSGGAYGALYSGDSTGPHLHADIRDNGVQWGMEEWLAKISPASVSTPVVIESPIIKQEEDSMKNKFFITNDGAALYVGAPGMKTLIHIERFETLLALREILATGESGPLSIIGVQEIQAIMSQIPA